MAAAKQELSLRGKTMLVPEMGRYPTRALAAGIEGLLGARVRILPTGSESDLSLGKKQSSGKECWPFIQTTADILTELKRLREGGDGLKDLVLLMPQANGPCRFGQYIKSQRIILHENGFGGVAIVSPTTADSYTLGGILTKNEAKALRKVAFNAIVFADVLNRMVWRTRPYEREPGLADKVGEKSLDAVCEMIKESAKGMTSGLASYKPLLGLSECNDILDKLKDIAEDFKAAIDPAIPRKPLVLLIGEIYLRAHAHSNHDIVKNLEGLGCETVVASMAEWLNYLTHEKVYEESKKFKENFALNSLSKKIDLQNVKQLFKYELTLRYQYGAMDRAYDSVSALGIQRDHKIGHLFENLGDWYHPDLFGEAVLSIASGITAEKESFDGVGNVYPFGCMPSTNALIVLGGYYADHAERNGGVVFPFVNVPCDDTNQPTRFEELGLFVDNARQHMERRIGAHGVSAKAF